LKIVVCRSSREDAYAAMVRTAFGNCCRHQVTMARAAIDHYHQTYSDALEVGSMRGRGLGTPGVGQEGRGVVVGVNLDLCAP